ncbi:MAG TPA: hypothetical protein DEH78_03840 [Solibacterales bacterium]|nr:hypothetical protein [Bryobacterales bacterium]
MRIWFWLALAILQAVFLFVAPSLAADGLLYALALNAVGSIAILVWWLFFSGQPRVDRWLAVLWAAVAVVALYPLLHESISGAGMGRLYLFHVIPVSALALVAGAAAGRGQAAGARRALLALFLLLAPAAFLLLRTEGVTGEGRSQFALRWTQTPEQRLLAAEPVSVPSAPPAAAAPAAAPETLAREESKSPPAPAPAPAQMPAEWPGFRGVHRDGRVPGLRVATDWTAQPPTELWRREVGPGWSSFAIGGGLAFTQEQRGDYEVIAAYRLETGEPAWSHRTAARFYESNGGPGPRGTPALHEGRLYAIGATGIVTALDAATGTALWSRNAATDTGAKIPEWGISSSPLIVNGLLIVAASGRLAAYDPASGKQVWAGAAIGGSYSSPHLALFGKTEQIVFLAGQAVFGVSPADGRILWRHDWEGSKIIQPSVTADGALLVTTGGMSGGEATRRLSVAPASGGEWKVTEAWTSRGLKPYYNDLVIHKGHAFGFDASILSCIDVNDGQRKWKGGRYGFGQMLLLPDQDLLLILSEQGEVALVSATPDQYREVGRFQAIEGKTWNHPAMAGDVLLVRNDREMAAFRLTRAKD